MLTKDLLRVSRRGADYRPQFVSPDRADLVARVIGIYQGHVGRQRGDLEAALADQERKVDDFKLVRGFAKLLEQEATFETRAPIEPEHAREVSFEAAESVGVVTEAERMAALDRAADRLGVEPDDLDGALYADLDERQVLVEFDPRWTPDELVVQYNLSLAMTALFDATEVRVRSSDPRTLVSSVKWLGLMYEVRKTNERREGSDVRGRLPDREVVVTGPDALFRSTRRYGTRFARLLRTVAGASEWRLEATIDDRGTERTMRLSDEDPVAVPSTEPIEEMRFDSGVEAEFAARFEALNLDWTLVREPEPLEAGERVMIPDFAFDYAYGDFRIFFEIMGFWTPEYVQKKLSQLGTVEDVEMLVAVNESLGVGEAVEARDHRVFTYSDSIRLKDVRNALRRYEDQLVAASAATLPDELVPAADVVTLADLAAEQGVSEDAIEEKTYPEHVRVGRTLVRPVVLEDLRRAIDPGMSLDEAEAVFKDRGLVDVSAALSALGYRVEWEGLAGGTVREK